MNKFGIIIGVAAVATLAGCKDPNYNRHYKSPALNDQPKQVADDQQKPAKFLDVKTDETQDADTLKCKCAPGTVHEGACGCGAADCKCVTVTKKADDKKPAKTADKVVTPAPAADETTVYIVQNGDYLAKISKKFNITIPAIKRLNPTLKGDTIFVGQKLLLPGKVDVGEQKMPTAAVKPAKAAYAPYTGDTVEYAVKSGDTLGAIAYGNGINIRQLKELNGLASDSLKVGQKLKVPANGKALAAAQAAAKAKTPKKDDKPAVSAKKDNKPAVAAVTDAEGDKTSAPIVIDAVDGNKAQSDVLSANATPPAPVVVGADAPAADDGTIPYTIQEGDDITGLTIRFGVTASQVRELNNLGDDDLLKPGQVIKLPADAQQ